MSAGNIEFSRNEDQTLEDKVRRALPKGKYHSIKKIGSNGTRRANFSGGWGRNGSSRPVRIKVDMTPKDEMSRRMTEKGYGTGNDLAVLSHLPYDEALSYGISPVLDYEEIDGLVVTVEPEFTGGESIADFFRDRQPTKEEFGGVIAGITRAVKYAHDNGFYHRDLTTKNCMVRKSQHGLEFRLTDWEVAVPRDNVNDAPFTTTGTRSLRDPLLESQPYSDQSEIYQIAMNAISLFTKDPLKWYEIEELKDPDKRKKAIKDSVAKIPKDVRNKHASWIERGLTINPDERFNSFNEFALEVNKANAPSFLDAIRKRWKSIAATALTTAALAGTGGYVHNVQTQRAHLEELAEASIPRVKSQWNGRGLETFNDKINFEMTLSGYEGSNKDKHQWYPYRNKFLKVEPGQNLTFSADVSADIDSNDSMFGAYVNFEGRFYIEGEPFDDGEVAKEFYANAENPDRAKREYAQYYDPSTKYFNLPSNLKEGVHIFAAEIFAPTEEKMNVPRDGNVINNWAKAKIRFDYPGEVIARKRIPLVVGNPEVPAEIYSIGFKWHEEEVRARKLEENIEDWGYTVVTGGNVHFFAEAPSIGYSNQVGSYGWLGLPLPGEQERQTELYLHVRDSEGRLIGFTGVPIGSKPAFTDELISNGVTQEYYWDFRSMGREFAERLVEYKRSLPYQVETPEEK